MPDDPGHEPADARPPAATPTQESNQDRASPTSRLMQAMHGPVYRRRLEVLSRAIGEHLKTGDRVLDVGCGVGTLGSKLIEAFPEMSLHVEGLERYPRGGEAIPVTAYAGGRMPFDDDAFDVVTIADVLHHEPDPDTLLGECLRVARRAVIVKDHTPGDGPAPWRAWKQARIALMDWAANAPYGVKCLYRYPRPSQWRAMFDRLSAGLAAESTHMRLYPLPFSLVFTGGLQYFAVITPSQTQSASSPD